MKLKFIKIVAIAAAILLIPTSAFAAWHFDVLQRFFRGDTAPVQEFVKTPKDSISNGHFVLTLEELLTDGVQSFMVCSIKGLDAEAIDELMNTDMFMNPEVSFNGEFLGVSASEIVEKRTDYTRYWSYWVNGHAGEISTRFIEGQSIPIPMDSNIETRKLLLEGQPYGTAKITISPLGLAIEKGMKDEEMRGIATTWLDDVLFRLQDGKVKAYLEVIGSGINSAQISPYEENGYARFKFDGHFYEVTPLENFQSIIIGQIEYDIIDGAIVDESFAGFLTQR